MWWVFLVVVGGDGFLLPGMGNGLSIRRSGRRVVLGELWSCSVKCEFSVLGVLVFVTGYDFYASKFNLLFSGRSLV
jgi:hypothetical protein